MEPGGANVKGSQPDAPGEARCPGPNTQTMARRDGSEPPYPLNFEAYEFLGDADIPFERYTSAEFARREFAAMWNRAWQWACREEEIPDVGDYVVYDIGPYSILVIRSSATDIRAFHNSCLHRGTKLKPSGADGTTAQLRCPYHGWTWNIDGSLKSIPCRWDFPHVKDATFRLPEVKTGRWGGFVFINMDPAAPALLDYLGVLPDHFAKWSLEDRYIALHIVKELDCNWKLAVEAFIEGYHTLETHPQLLSSSPDAAMQYDVFGDNVGRHYMTTGFQSPHIERTLSEQEILDDILMGDRSMIDPARLKVGPGESARGVLARFLREELGKQYQADLSQWSDAEMIDAIEYNLFPNMILFPGISLPMVYRFRPVGMDPNRTEFELLFLRPVGANSERPSPALPHRMKEDELFADVPGMDPTFGHVYDQDTGNLRLQQQGMIAAHKRGETLGNYQEVRIRQLHRTLDKYLR
jgi:phenylpropionate dioxygenase-like ring-hydroxylating dioxygenase large terminal subunit